MRKMLTLILVAVTTVISMTGCSEKTPPNIDVTDAPSPVVIMDTPTDDIANASPLPSPTNRADIFVGDYQIFDCAQIRDTLLHNASGITKVETDDTKQANSGAYTTQEGDFLAVIPGSIVYRTRFEEPIRNILNLSNIASTEQGNPFAQKTNLAFSSCDDALNAVTELLRSFGIIPVLQETYCLDYKVMEQMEQSIKDNPVYAEWIKSGRIILNDSWSEDDECYYFTFAATLYGIPFDTSDRPKGQSDSFFVGSSIEAIYSKNGIQALSVVNIYSVADIVQNGVEIVDSSVAIAEFQKKIDSMISTSPLNIVDVALVYIPELISKDQNLPYTFRPCWKITTEQSVKSKTGGETTVGNSFYFDATTGKEIL